jgi:hypothetical protein
LLGPLVAVLAMPAWASAAEVRYVQENGVTYAESTRIVRRPVCETRYEERQRTVYRRQTQTELKEVHRNVLVPVTEYRREMRWVGRWNPFVQPYLAERLVPTTRWETRTEVAQVPMMRTQLIPETRTERVPVLTRRIVEEPVTSRVVVANPPAVPAGRAAAPVVAERTRVGGVSKLESDPPRQGASFEWRPASGATRR